MVLGWEPWHARAACRSSELGPLFTVDDPTEDEKAAMRAVCRSCRALLDCRRRVTATEPTSGFWAGRFYGGQIPAALTEKPRLRPIVEMTAEQRVALWAAIEPTPGRVFEQKRDVVWLVPVPDPIQDPAIELALASR